MKIAVNIIVEVDPDVWADEYGIDKDEVRQDVKEHLLTNVQGAPGIQSTDAAVTLR